MVLEKTLESPLDCKEIQPVHSEGDQPWDFFGRNNAKAETPVLWPGEFHALYSPWGHKQSDPTEQLSLSLWYSCERLLLNHANTPGFLAPGGEEFNPRPETRLDRSELLCSKVFLKYKGDRESF